MMKVSLCELMKVYSKAFPELSDYDLELYIDNKSIESFNSVKVIWDTNNDEA